MRRVYSVVLSLVCLTALCNVWLYTRVAPTQLARQNNEGGPLGLLPPPPKGSVQPRKTKDVEYKDYLSVCTVFKNEGAYLEEWIRFHTVVGVTRFYLYDDASTDDSRAVLRPFVQSGLVRVHNVQDVHVRDDKEYRMAQTGSFKHCLREYSTETQWMMFIDVDEFLFPSGGGSLPAVLALYEDHPGLVVRGLVFGSTRHVTRPSGLVIENYLLRAEARHPTFAEKEDDVLFQVKSIVNPRLAMPCQGQSHYFCYVSGEAVNERFEIHNTTTKGKAYIDAIRYNHYKAKSYSDYLAKKDKGVVQGKHTGKFLKAGNQWVNLDINDVYDDLIWQHYGEVLRDSFPSAPSPSIIPDASTSSTRVRMCSKPATIVVLGMHHSATSVLARMIRHMGAYGGEMTEFELAPGPNPSKYWERRDLCEANHNVLIPQTTRGPWYMGMGFNVSAITPAQEDTFMMQATKVIERTRRSGGVHFLKDPRMCLTMAMWRPLLLQDGNPLVCVIPYRHPMHVASSIVGFKGQTDGLNISDALLVWEKYHVSALKACQGLPTILVRQDEMLHDPYGAMLRLHRDWTTIIAPPDMDHATMNALTPPDRTFIMQNIYNARKEKTTSNVTDDDSMLDRMRPSAAQLFASLWSGSALGKDYGPWGTPTLMHGEAHNTDTHRAEEKHLPRYLEHIRFWTVCSIYPSIHVSIYVDSSCIFVLDLFFYHEHDAVCEQGHTEYN
eukprot:TRINITY_DN5074_c0_g1_i7.p1 TRINITY_DN5074_c0_g1~~TRINITY_DN5074_c0_g1_i7.p1  ORF type:complete len:721 (+),score=180.90 TRINITY_DN5074_c0_g1_i7:104-2266(+)